MRSKIFATVVLAIGSIVAIGNSPALAIGATTDPATGVTEAGAVLSGTVTHATGSYITAIAIAPTPSFAQSVYSYSGVCDPAMQVQLRRGQVFDVLGGSGTAHVSEDMRFWNASCAMSPLTTYYYRIGIQDPIDNACVYSMSCYTWGSTESFTTRAALLPTVGVATSAEVGPDSALLAATVTATDGFADVSLEYSTSAALASPKTVSVGRLYPAGINGGIGAPFTYPGSKRLTGLIESTTYYYRFVATSPYGTTRGDISSFVTKPPVGISINEAAEFTNSPSVTISVSWPVNAESMLVSNDGGFRTQRTVALTENVAWTLLSSGDEKLPKTVYLKFILADGSRSSVYADDIILDTTAPVVTQASGAAVASSTGIVLSALRPTAKKNAARLRITGKDGNSGIASVQIKTSIKGSVTTVPVNKSGNVSTTVIVKSTKKLYLVRMVDRAGNSANTWKTVRISG